jgi:hypothetical protein
MNNRLLAGALALGVALVSTAALADDPNDPSMRSAAARARDKAIIKRLNEEQLAYVRKRDARYAQGWRATRDAAAINAANRARYQRDMAAWRRAVRLCQAGRREYCAR